MTSMRTMVSRDCIFTLYFYQDPFIREVAVKLIRALPAPSQEQGEGATVSTWQLVVERSSWAEGRLQLSSWHSSALCLKQSENVHQEDFFIMAVSVVDKI